MGYSLFDGSYIHETFHMDDVTCVAATPKALICAGGRLPKKRNIVPLSQISEDSEVVKVGDVGCLIVTEWFAETAGWTKQQELFNG